MRVSRYPFLLLIVSGPGVEVGVAPQAEVIPHTVTCGGRPYRYLLYVPAHATRAPVPAIMLLHGAGDRPDPMIAAWQPIATAEGIVLIAPEIPRVESFEPLAPTVFRCVAEDARHAAVIDPARIYLFGHSMGGYLAYDGAMLESRYFAAAAIHAMGVAKGYDWIVDSARRKTPIAIYIGDRDPLVSLASVRRTRDLLRSRHFPVHYRELKDHDHNYYARSKSINADAWNFFKHQRMRSDRP